MLRKTIYVDKNGFEVPKEGKLSTIDTKDDKTSKAGRGG